ncbi:hypothetical protein DE146DRAFT_750076 [Phaeosphaeria sp. MPI-PUGE-AT-0046c]|nr:hypothetical protein DE146DRAFT_750076 [Phaeosphaeria sp. MPI-PUGE-AT-0046c]
MAFTPEGMYSLCTILTVIATAAVVARTRVRVRQKAKLLMDDWTAVGGLVVLWSVAGVILAGTGMHFYGTHTEQDAETGESNITQLDRDNVEYMWIVVILGILSIGLIKLSVLLLYRRLFNVSRIFNIYSAVLIALTVFWTVGFLAANIFQCGTYPAAAWTSGKMLIKYCDDISMATTSRAITNAVMDLLIVVSPLPIIWQMRMSLTQKIQVTGIFALGFMAVAAGIVRAYLLLLDTIGPNRLGYRDLQGQNSQVVAWTLIEIVAALVGCCLPTLRPLFTNTTFGRLMSSLFSTVSVRSRKGRLSEKKMSDENLAIVTIGGTKLKNSNMEHRETESDPSQLRDVGNLA